MLDKFYSKVKMNEYEFVFKIIQYLKKECCLCPTVQFFKRFKHLSLNNPPPETKVRWLDWPPPQLNAHTYKPFVFNLHDETISRNNNCLKTNIWKLSFFHLMIWVSFPYVHLTAQIFILNNLFCLFSCDFLQIFKYFFYRFWWLLYR